MNKMQKKADEMIKDIKRKEEYLISVERKIKDVQKQLKITNSQSSSMRSMMRDLDREIKALKQKKEMVESQNFKLNAIQKGY